MEQIIRNIITQLVGAEAGQAGKEEDLRELGLDSVAFIKVIVALEEAAGHEISDEFMLLDAMSTIAQMEKALQ